MFPKHPICACHRLACPPAQRPLARLGARPPACPRACLPTRPPTHLSSCPPACPLFRPPVRLSAYCNRESADAVTKNGFEQQTQTPIPKFKTSEKAFRCLRKKRPRLSRNGKSSSAPAPQVQCWTVRATHGRARAGVFFATPERPLWSHANIELGGSGGPHKCT